MELSAVRTVEEQLLTSAARRDRKLVRELLHADFVEIGRSGRRLTRDEIVDALMAETERATPLTEEWKLIELGPEIALVTYVIRDAGRDSRHSSIWTSEGERLQMRFHQGTFIARQ